MRWVLLMMLAGCGGGSTCMVSGNFSAALVETYPADTDCSSAPLVLPVQIAGPSDGGKTVIAVVGGASLTARTPPFDASPHPACPASAFERDDSLTPPIGHEFYFSTGDLYVVHFGTTAASNCSAHYALR